MRKRQLLLTSVFAIILFLITWWIYHLSPSKVKVSAYMRVKNEIKTVRACLDSIDGLFDRIVIIHSREPGTDDGTNAFLKKWCRWRFDCDLYEYPHRVYASASREYVIPDLVKPENTMAAYSNFGIDKFEPEEWVMNIDADQVYIRNRLEPVIQQIRQERPEDQNKVFCLLGYNTFLRKGVFLKTKKNPIMGRACDHFMIKRKNFKEYGMKKWATWFYFKPLVEKEIIDNPVWFHFRKQTHKKPTADGWISQDDVPLAEVLPLTIEEQNTFRTEMPVYFAKDSPFYIDNLTFCDPDLEKMLQQTPK